jgi:hypothetical protein
MFALWADMSRADGFEPPVKLSGGPRKHPPRPARDALFLASKRTAKDEAEAAFAVYTEHPAPADRRGRWAIEFKARLIWEPCVDALLARQRKSVRTCWLLSLRGGRWDSNPRWPTRGWPSAPDG